MTRVKEIVAAVDKGLEETPAMADAVTIK